MCYLTNHYIKTTLLTLLLLAITTNSYSQKRYKIHTVAFYNLENLFDPVNDTSKNDEASPIMEIKIDRDSVYANKIKNMAKVIADIGHNTTKTTPTIIGVSEIENKTVLENLINDNALKQSDYGIIHYDSPDSRGIDVGLLYKKQQFTPINHSKHLLKLQDKQTLKRIYTRDVLLVSGKLENELIHIIVNHWPSRRGGLKKSNPNRIAAAKLNKKIIDSLQSENPYAKIITMGDLNDNPNNESVKSVLKAKSTISKTRHKNLYNPMMNMFKKGLGSNAYQDSWSLFDQIMLSKPFLKNDFKSLRFYKAGIFNKTYLTNKKGRYKGYPFRSFANNSFTNGYSDHFPVYVFLVKGFEL